MNEGIILKKVLRFPAGKLLVVSSRSIYQPSGIGIKPTSLILYSEQVVQVILMNRFSLLMKQACVHMAIPHYKRCNSCLGVNTGVKWCLTLHLRFTAGYKGGAGLVLWGCGKGYLTDVISFYYFHCFSLWNVFWMWYYGAKNMTSIFYKSCCAWYLVFASVLVLLGVMLLEQLTLHVGAGGLKGYLNLQLRDVLLQLRHGRNVVGLSQSDRHHLLLTLRRGQQTKCSITDQTSKYSSTNQTSKYWNHQSKYKTKI